MPLSALLYRKAEQICVNNASCPFLSFSLSVCVGPEFSAESLLLVKHSMQKLGANVAYPRNPLPPHKRLIFLFGSHGVQLFTLLSFFFAWFVSASSLFSIDCCFLVSFVALVVVPLPSAPRMPCLLLLIIGRVHTFSLFRYANTSRKGSSARPINTVRRRLRASSHWFPSAARRTFFCCHLSSNHLPFHFKGPFRIVFPFLGIQTSYVCLSFSPTLFFS